MFIFWPYFLIFRELSNLRHGSDNQTHGFSELKRVRCVKGCYPSYLIDLWQLYYENGKSENDSPEMFGANQLYIVLELVNGGIDMEAFTFNNSRQAHALFKQVGFHVPVNEYIQLLFLELLGHMYIGSSRKRSQIRAPRSTLG